MLYCVASQEYSFFSEEKDKLKKKLYISSEYVIDEPEFLVESIESFGQGGLFGGEKPLLVFKDIPSLGELAYLEKVISLHIANGYQILLYVPLLTKDVQNIIDVHTGMLLEQKKPIFEKKEVTPFGLTDLFMKRDKKNSWLTFLEIKRELEIGQIISGLFWMAKTMLLVKRAKTISDTELKPFVYNKTKQSIGLWSESEIESLLLTLLTIQAQEQFDEEAQTVYIEKLIFSL